MQQLIGQGGMGAVYLAQQSRPRRQVAVKVLLPTTPLKPHHLAAFLERFRRETDAAASLEHPNIMPVYEYGEQDGLAYLVMPYIGGGTLRDVMEVEGQMLLPKVVNYLEQLAAALDFAHARGVVHRDIKPANILITQEGRLLLTDFGLVKIVTEEGQAQVRLTGAGAPVGTPDYMSPEQVMGDEVDGRADLYSLGIILFQMLTATTPFQGETPMQIAAQQLHAQPPMPRRFRAELPEAAQQVILRSLSKRPADRYASGLEMATAFRLALNTLDAHSMASRTNVFETDDRGFDSSDLLPRKGLFDPKWQTGALLPAVNAQGAAIGDFGRLPSGSVPAVQPGMMGTPGMPARSTGLLSRTGMFPSIGNGGSGAMPTANMQMPGPTTPTGSLSTSTGAQRAAPGFIPATPQDAPTAFGQSGISQLSPSLNVSTGAYAVPGYQGASPTVKLTGPVKVVQVPIAPGQYVTGLLPVPALGQPPTPVSPRDARVALLKKIALSVVILLVLVGGSIGFLEVRSHLLSERNSTLTGTVVSGTPNVQATNAARATATAMANIILFDPLSHNVRGLPEGTSATRAFAFKNGAYHVTNLGKQGVAVVVPYALQNVPMVYQLTMNEVRGDDTSPVNSFGMIFRYNQQTKGGVTVSTFYSFEVVNTTGTSGKYWFYKYDSSAANPWTPLWSQNFGAEFKEGQGPNVLNTFKVLMNGGNFSFVVNGKLVNSKPVVDTSFPAGIVGMLVNLNGTEVAFSQLEIIALPH
ncbi:MAG TPA: protein kinase [Ktedonobacteraceae bacterium]|nr:protein kinase [Ktedonobacteraceae bacterium]